MKSQLYAGTARLDITPEPGHSLAGWILRRPSTHKITPILARALVLASADTCLALCTCDLLWVPGPLSRRLREAVQEACGIPLQHIFIFPSHNHFGPDVDVQTPQEQAYVDTLLTRFASIVRQARDNLRPARWGTGHGREESIAINSRFWRRDGTIAWVAAQLEQSAGATGPIDPEVGVLLICDEQGQAIATLYNYACHANCQEGAGISAVSWDWVGYASQTIESALGGEAFFLLGACGNIHPARYQVANEMGKKLAGEVIHVAQEVKTISRGSIAAWQREFVLPARDFSSFDPQQIKTICAQIEDEKTRLAVEAVFFDRLQALRTERRSRLTTEVGIIRLDDLAIVCIPGELFVELGLEIKERSPFPYTWVAELVNDAIGYIPTRQAYEEGGYQTTTVARVAPEAGELIVEESLTWLRDLRDFEQ